MASQVAAQPVSIAEALDVAASKAREIEDRIRGRGQQGKRLDQAEKDVYDLAIVVSALTAIVSTYEDRLSKLERER